MCPVCGYKLQKCADFFKTEKVEDLDADKDDFLKYDISQTLSKEKPFIQCMLGHFYPLDAEQLTVFI